jgi:threonine dehydratase
LPNRCQSERRCAAILLNMSKSSGIDASPGLPLEPSAAVPVAVLLEGGLRVRSLRVGVILSGENIDLDALPWITS